MGFCRRCGDIVTGVRCKCGGTAVAPVILWNNNAQGEDALDKWSKTYIAREPSVSPIRRVQSIPLSPSDPITKEHHLRNNHSRSTHPGASSNVTLDEKVSEYITRTTSLSSHSTTSPKPFLTANPNADILPSIIPHDTTLSKVYGSLLQSKETLATHSCAICSVSFAPDATIYPDPSNDGFGSDCFLCRQCYISNGGSKGACALCSKPVLTLKSEGGFIHAAGKYWHKLCFNCNGCSVNVSESPMVDLFGRPSCLECFETCLKRDNSTPKKPVIKSETRNDAGIMTLDVGDRIREMSPGIEELEQRLGIAKNRQSSPALEELTQRLSTIGKDISTKQSPSPGPGHTMRSFLPHRGGIIPSPNLKYPHKRYSSPAVVPRNLEQPSTTHPTTPTPANLENPCVSGSPYPTQEAIEEMKQRFLKNSPRYVLEANTAGPILDPITPLRSSRSLISLRSSSGDSQKHCNRTPPHNGSPPSHLSGHVITDFAPEVSESGTLFSLNTGVNHPLPYKINEELLLDDPTTNRDSLKEVIPPQKYTPRVPSLEKFTVYDDTIPLPRHYREEPLPLENGLTETSCTRCCNAITPVRNAGHYIIAPRNGYPKDQDAYHADCFRCFECNKSLSDNGKGKAVFTRTKDGQPCHIQCAPKESVPLRKSISSGTLRQRASASSHSSETICSSSQLPSSSSAYNVSSSRYENSVLASSSVIASSSRFGSRSACPGCNKLVSPMELGVVPGPQGTRWHASCLVCGGKKEAPKGPAWILNRGRECNKKTEPGCGKKLDSAARIDHEGRVWCRECLLLLGIGGSPQSSPTRMQVIPSHTGSSVVPQYTGGTTIARQFTGIGAGEPNTLRQLTGGLNPTRSVSPTKQLGLVHGAGSRRPRPKSVIGMRSSKSVDEGRGMFLARQLTGASSIQT